MMCTCRVRFGVPNLFFNLQLNRRIRTILLHRQAAGFVSTNVTILRGAGLFGIMHPFASVL